MSMQNLAIVFGPTLFGQSSPANGQANGAMADAPHQNQVSTHQVLSSSSLTLCNWKAIETILNHYTDIFVDETD